MYQGAINVSSPISLTLRIKINCVFPGNRHFASRIDPVESKLLISSYVLLFFKNLIQKYEVLYYIIVNQIISYYESYYILQLLSIIFPLFFSILVYELGGTSLDHFAVQPTLGYL